MRKGPSTEYGIEIALPKGTKVMILSRDRSPWYEIYAKEKSGYVMAKYLKFE